MPEPARRFFAHLLRAFRTAFVGPQLLAFVPALMLAGYWFGGEALLILMAIFLPAVVGLVGLFNPSGFSPSRRKNTDAATGLPLRKELIHTLDASFASERETGERVAAMVLELDDFERHAAHLGDEAADRILRVAAERMQSVLRHGDLLARLDGAQFGIALLPNRRLDLEAMIQLSARLQRAISEPLPIDGLALHLSLTVGFCLARRAAEKSGEACLDAALSALDDAQANGPGSIRSYASKPRVKRVIRSGFLAEVPDALENGQIVPWFQPQISTDTGGISGMEALARWIHPERGTVLPGAFLPAVAAAGLTRRLTEVIMYQSMAALRDWDALQLTVPCVGINLSGEDLSDPTLCDRIRWELDRFDLAPGRLAIEVLETVIATSDDDTITRNIAALADMGCGIDLDDFGTGHASIASIRRFSVNRIKIDRSFVTCIDTDREQQQMLNAILDMAVRLSLGTLAEGVETVAEHALLAQLGCGHVQGYGIAKPMPFEDVAPWMTAYRAKLLDQPRIARETG